MEDRIFRKIWVIEPSHDFRLLYKHSQRIEFLFHVEQTPDLMLKIAHSLLLEDFIPESDAIVPAGKSLLNMLVGTVLSKIGCKSITVGLYKDHKYEFVEVRLDSYTG